MTNYSNILSAEKSILFLTNWLYPCKTGGIEIFHYYFIQAISNYFSCIVMTIGDVDLGRQNIQVHNIKSPLGRYQKIFTIYYHLKVLFKRRKQISLIHIPYSSKQVFQFYHVMILARLFNIPYILRIHGGGMYPGKPNFLHALYFKKAQNIIAVSQPIKEEYEKRYGREIKLIQSYLPFLQSTYSKNQLREKHRILLNNLLILYVGSIKQIKGTHILIDAIAHLEKTFLQKWNVSFLIVGGGDQENFLRQKAVRLELTDYVRFTGNMPYETVHEFFQIADIFVIPSLMEARPLVLAEALYNGLPAIGSDISTIANTINEDETGLLFEAGNPLALSTAICTMVQNPEMRKRFSEKCLLRKEEFNLMDQMVEEYVNYYRQIMLENCHASSA